jgi:ligand-binding sensor domain-containing protein/serine phosphatase RsbU (regulator of sigma subunit)
MQKIFFISFFLFLSFLTNAQTYRFKTFDAEKDGLYPYIYSLHQDSVGFLWIGTGEGLFRYDGHNFNNFDLSSVSKDNFISASTTDGKSKSWFGQNNGDIFFFDGKNYSKDTLPVSNPGAITSMNVMRDGTLWVTALNAGLCKMTPDRKKQLFPKAFSGILTYCSLPAGKFILIGTGDGLFLFDPANPDVLKEVSGGPVSKVECIYYSKQTNQYYFGTEDAGLFSLSNPSFEVKELFPELQLSKATIKDIVTDNNKGLWVATMGNGLYHISLLQNNSGSVNFVNYTPANGLPSVNIRKLLIDREGNLWMGTYGNGLITFLENYFTFLFQGESLEESFYSVFPYKNNIWIGGKGKLFSYSDALQKENQVFDGKHGIPNDKITSLYFDNEELLWFGTDKNGLFIFNTERKKAIPVFISEDLLVQSISSIDGFGDHLYVGTHNGLVIIDKTNNTNLKLTTADGLPHNFVTHLISDVHSNLWIATPTNQLCKYTNDKLEKIKINKNDDLIKVNSICLDTKGRLWIATYGNGIYYRSDSGFVNINSLNGLLSDYCYSLTSDETGTVWIGHRQGFSAINNNVIKTYGKNRGIITDCNLNAISVDAKGIMWVGTTNGVLRYDFRKNSLNNTPPGIYISGIRFNEHELDLDSLQDLPYKTYKVIIDFAGISFRDPDLIKYRYKLEGFDSDWSELTSINSITYSRLLDGNYTFLIEAYNADGVKSYAPFRLEFSINPPIWKKWWFILLCVIIFVYSFYLFIKIRERNHRKREEILQRTLDIRTREVVEQKELIEQKNKDITDSINYAKRIQEAILPAPAKLKAVFPDSFVFYMPRDIVSGDFYVFHQTCDKFVLICADATGHGVPGAFMSLISSTILKDIIQKKNLFSPSQILYELDKELQLALQSEGNTYTSDGLDVAICVFDMKVNSLCFASAMRPVLLYKKDTVEYIRGSKFSIGASKHFINKEFTEHLLRFEKGDSLYLFSDGFPDQFGGKNGKKLKIIEMKKWFDEIHTLPMNEQNTLLKQKFTAWKGNYPQIDDVLVIGIKC